MTLAQMFQGLRESLKTVMYGLFALLITAMIFQALWFAPATVKAGIEWTQRSFNSDLPPPATRVHVKRDKLPDAQGLKSQLETRKSLVALFKRELQTHLSKIAVLVTSPADDLEKEAGTTAVALLAEWLQYRQRGTDTSYVQIPLDEIAGIITRLESAPKAKDGTLPSDAPEVRALGNFRAKYGDWLHSAAKASASRLKKWVEEELPSLIRGVDDSRVDKFRLDDIDDLLKSYPQARRGDGGSWHIKEALRKGFKSHADAAAGQ